MPATYVGARKKRRARNRVSSSLVSIFHECAYRFGDCSGDSNYAGDPLEDDVLSKKKANHLYSIRTGTRKLDAHQLTSH